MFDDSNKLKVDYRLLAKNLFAGGVSLWPARNKQVVDDSLNSNVDVSVAHRVERKFTFMLLLFFVLLLGAASPALACKAFGGVIDGDVVGTAPQGQVQIDSNCTIRNFPASNPLTTNFSFFQPGNSKQKYLVVFDNVVHTGSMSCNATHEHKIWFTNGSSTSIQDGCQNLLIPVEKIDKQNPAATASIGVPFTYTLTIPVLFDPGTGGVINNAGSVNDLHTIVITDDLNATGAALTLVGTPSITYLSSGAAVPHTFSNVGGLLTFSDFPVVFAGEQFIIDITVVLDDIPSNTVGTQFINTAKWDFGRLIDNKFYDPLPGEWGVTTPMTIVEPDLVVTKTSNETALNLGVSATFTIDVQNNGGGDAWNVTILDLLPDGATAGMCDFDPTIAPGFSAQIFEADGVTPVSGVLVQGTDYSATHTGVPTCELSLTMLTPAAVIGASERLIITYQSQLDGDTTGDGIALTNIAGATEWFSADASSSPRVFTRTLSSGTPLTTDHEDNYIITTGLSGYYFQKLVENLETGANPAVSAAPGDRLRYRLRLFNVDQTIDNIAISDLIDLTRFDASTFSMVTLPAGVTFNFNAGTGQLDIVGSPSPLNLTIGNELNIEFEINLLTTLVNNDIVLNQASLIADGPLTADSDDPFINGIAAPTDPADATRVIIQASGPLVKANTHANATIGEQFTYTITVPATPVLVPLYDVRILDDLIPSNADMSFVSANVLSGGGWTLTNTGTTTSLVIEDTSTGIDIPANGQAVIEVTVELLNTASNNDGLTFNNSALFTYNRANGNSATQTLAAGNTTADMTVVEPGLTITKVGTLITAPPVGGGSIIEYVITMTNSGSSVAYDVNVVDNLPVELALDGSFTPTATIAGNPVVGFDSVPGGVPVGPLIWGQGNGDGSLDIPVGDSLVLTYQTQVQVSTATTFDNTAWIDWSSLDNASISERSGAGCPTITAPDDYCATVTSTTFSIVDSNSLSKLVIADSWTTDGSTAVDATVRVGDTVTYQLTLSLGEGTTNSVSISDVMPAGMVFDSLLSITPASNPTPGAGDFNYTVLSQPVVGDSGTLVWDLGDVVNTPSNDGTPTDTLVIEYTARVIENDASTIAQSPSTTLTNTATLAYIDSIGTPVVNPAQLESQESITVLQPVLSPVTKTGNTLANTVATPLNINITTDIVQFQVESCNATGLAPAYSVMLTDVLATQLNDTTLTVPVVTANGVVLTAVTDYIYTPPAGRGGTVQIELLVPVDVSECVTVDYDIGFYTDFPSTQTWSNSVTVDEYWSLPASSGQQYGPLGPAQFFMTNIVGVAPLSKVVSSPASGEITIGEEAVYTITIPATPFNAALNNVVITDPLFSALTYISSTAVGNSFAMVDTTADQNVNLSFAQIPANEQVTITLRSRLDNNATANAGVSFTNTATYTSPDLPGPIVAVSGALTIVEPGITINKSVSPTAPPNPGGILTYSVTFTASSGVNFSDAFDLRIDDDLSLGLAYQGGSASVDGAGNTIIDPTVTGDGIATAQTLVWDLATATADIDVVEGTTVTVTYDVLVLAGVSPGQNLTNSASAQWTGLDNVDVNERDGTGVPVENDYFTAPVATTLTSQSGALLKQTTQATATIGEQFTYRITVPAVPQSTDLNDVRILDNLNTSVADITFISVTKVSGSQPWVPGNTSGDTKNLVIEDSAIGIDIPAGEQAVVEITVVLDDSATNTSGLVFNNTADYTYGVTQLPGLPSTSGDMTIVGPDTVTLEKTGPVDMSVGTAETFTLNVQNTGTATAWDLTVTDILPNLVTGGMCDTAPTNITAQIFQADGVTPVSAVLVQGIDYISSFSGAPACSLTLTMQTAAAAIDATERLIVNYDAALDIDNVSGTILTNVAAATEWFGGDTAGTGATGSIRTYTGALTDGTVTTLDEQDAHNVNVQTPVLIFRKTVVNATTLQDPGTDAQPGETLRYTLYVENISPTPLLDFSLLDDLDALNAPALIVPGSLNVISAPAGADSSNTDPNGGVNSSGLLDVRNLSLDADGGVDIVEIVFEVTLAPVITGGTVVLNQAQINANGVVLADSDDPIVNGVDDPNVAGDEDPTETLITSAPLFLVQKTSQDITGDPADLQPGDTLRYTITVSNIGQEDAINVALSDQLPVNTTYLANTSVLNGVAVADAGTGVSALNAGLLINAPGNITPGFLQADSGASANNIVTMTFDVVVSPAAVAGTVISNQGFISGNGAGSGIFAQQPSDDPTTAAVDDPTIDVVGNVALFDVQKTVAIVTDGGVLGVVDPGDELRYTITSTNLGAVPVTNAVLIDAVPAFTTYDPDSVTLNGLPVGQPDGGVSPLIGGIDISSSDLPPPSAGAGTLSPGQSAVVAFDVVVDAGTLAGTTISNQGFVSNNELPTEPTDFDGIDSNGDQPTDVIVGQAPLITITKTVSVVGGGAALAGGELEYVIRVTNTGVVPVSNVVISDNLDIPIAGQMTYVVNSGLLNGLPTGISLSGSTLTADYSTNYGDLAAAATVEVRFRVLLANTLIVDDTVTNTGVVDWNLTETASATVSIDVGGIPPGSANLNGEVWHDTNFNDAVDVGETLLQGWTVELYSNNVRLASVLTDTNGVFQFSGLAPSIPTPLYELRYVAPGAVATTATLGLANSVFTNAPQRITDIDAPSGANVVGLNLPIQPNGVVYNSVVRVPVAGARLSMINQTYGNQPVPAECFDDEVQANQTTLADGFYKFDLNFKVAGRCEPGNEYEIQIQPPVTGYIGTTSVIIPPVVPVTDTAQDVITCPGGPGDLILATGDHCENSVSAALPSTAAADNYYLKFLFNNTPVRNQIFNNHIPIDPDLGGAVAISKVSGLQNVTRSQLVPYTITITNTFSVQLDDLIVVDNFPAGFKYVTGSSRVDKAEVEPVINDRRLTWDIQSLAVGESREIKLLLIVGSGVGEGEYINTAQMINTLTNAAASGIASATVRVIPDPTFDCTDIIGKVFDDKNMNAYQDKGEMGLPGVQVATARGLRVTTDKYGRFHITCAVVANEVRGSNFIMKLDDRSLPSGYRITSENPRVQRATRGKMLKFNFGAAIHRVVRLDLADGVFEKGTTELRPQWRSRIEILIIELQKDASILRLSYLGENETESEVSDRLDAIEALISKRWEEIDCCYKLTIETEVFWRKGNPSDRKGFE